MRTTITHLQQQKGVIPLVGLTAYTAPMAQLIDDYVDFMLVGDSVGTVLYGMDTTLGVTLDMMCAHGKAVVQASKNALIVIDMPFGTYQTSPEQAFMHAATLMQHTGCTAVKLEGGSIMADTIRFLAQRGIAVMGHLGLQPQSVHADGGYKYHGKTSLERSKILEDALMLQDAGAFAIVLESITESLARDITTRLDIPTIGIGASPACDGQILVTDDMIGMFECTPKFVKTYSNVRQLIQLAVESYTNDVKNHHFPETHHCFDLQDTQKLQKI